MLVENIDQMSAQSARNNIKKKSISTVIRKCTSKALFDELRPMQLRCAIINLHLYYSQVNES
jgi:hypothetical protein